MSASVHCYEDSEESYGSWKQNNIAIAADLIGEYSLKAEVSEENNAAYDDKYTASDNSEAETGTASAADTGEQTETTAEAVPAAQQVQTVQQGGLSIGVVIVIVIMASVIAVLATILVMTKKGGKS